MGVWLYPLFRRSLGVMSCHIWVWGPDATELWQHPYYRHYWHLPIPEGIRLSKFELPNGLAYRVLDPLTAYELRYRDGDALSVDLTFRAIHPAHELGITEKHGHIDQFGRLEGELVLYGEKIPIDCIEMRDRTWSPRREKRDRTWLGYSYGAASERYAFQQAVKVYRRPATSRCSGASRSSAAPRPTSRAAAGWSSATRPAARPRSPSRPSSRTVRPSPRAVTWSPDADPHHPLLRLGLAGPLDHARRQRGLGRGSGNLVPWRAARHARGPARGQRGDTHLLLVSARDAEMLEETSDRVAQRPGTVAEFNQSDGR